RIVLRSELCAGDVAHAYVTGAARVGADDDVAELLDVRQPSERLHRELEGAGGVRRRLVDGAGRDLQVGGADGVDHVGGGQAAGGDLAADVEIGRAHV